VWNREVRWVEARQGCLSSISTRLGPDQKPIEIEVEVQRKWTRLMEKGRPT
jgi:hypothetical protein